MANKLFNGNGTSFTETIVETNISSTFKCTITNFDNNPSNVFALEVKDEDGTWVQVTTFPGTFTVALQTIVYGFGVRLVSTAGTGGEFGYSVLQIPTLE